MPSKKTIKPFNDEEFRDWWSKTPGKHVAAGCACFDPKTRRVLIVKATYKNWWTFPGGLTDKNESPRQAAARETGEEVGLKVDADKLDFVGVEYNIVERANSDRIYFVFAAIASESDKLEFLDGEIEAAKWVSATKLRELRNNNGSFRLMADWLEGQFEPRYIEEFIGKVDRYEL